MKHLTPMIVILLLGGSVLATWKFFPEHFEACCEYLGLIAPDGVSEVPGVEHVSFAASHSGKLPADVPGLHIGGEAGEVSLLDLSGEEVKLEFGAGKVTAVVWVSSYCPTSKIYEERLNALYDAFPQVRWYAINSSAMDGIAELNKHFGPENPVRMRIPVFKDEGNVIADRFGAQVTTETFLFDQQGKLRYRGAVDDARNPQRVKQQFVRDSLRTLVSGGNPRWEYQPPNGCCPIDRVTPEEAVE